jgi:hypothetical protein
MKLRRLSRIWQGKSIKIWKLSKKSIQKKQLNIPNKNINRKLGEQHGAS